MCLAQDDQTTCHFPDGGGTSGNAVRVGSAIAMGKPNNNTGGYIGSTRRLRAEPFESLVGFTGDAHRRSHRSMAFEKHANQIKFKSNYGISMILSNGYRFYACRKISNDFLSTSVLTSPRAARNRRENGTLRALI